MDTADADAPTPFFGEGSPYLSHPLLTEERTSREVDEIETLVGSLAGRAVLDVGCGFGRHVVEAARRGAIVTGVDPSPTMVAEARRRVAAAELAAEITAGTATDVPGDGRFDVVLCLFTTLGQRDPSNPLGHGTDERLVDAAHRLLRPGGWFVAEVTDRDRALAALIERETLGPPDAPVEVTRWFDADTGVVQERFAATGSPPFALAYRIFAEDERRHLLRSAGFSVEVDRPRGLATPPPTLATIAARRPAESIAD